VRNGTAIGGAVFVIMMERGEVDDATGCESILKVIPVMSLAQTRVIARDDGLIVRRVPTMGMCGFAD
jgi:hypothetical protein